jgi:hypothetical protein
MEYPYLNYKFVGLPSLIGISCSQFTGFHESKKLYFHVIATVAFARQCSVLESKVKWENFRFLMEYIPIFAAYLNVG